MGFDRADTEQSIRAPLGVTLRGRPARRREGIPSRRSGQALPARGTCSRRHVPVQDVEKFGWALPCGSEPSRAWGTVTAGGTPALQFFQGHARVVITARPSDVGHFPPAHRIDPWALCCREIRMGPGRSRRKPRVTVCARRTVGCRGSPTLCAGCRGSGVAS